MILLYSTILLLTLVAPGDGADAPNARRGGVPGRVRRPPQNNLEEFNRRREAEAARQNQTRCGAAMRCCLGGGVMICEPCANCCTLAAEGCGRAAAATCTCTRAVCEASCGVIGQCACGCWRLVPTCAQCQAGCTAVRDCGCGAAVWCGNTVNDNCIQPCCVEALYRGCLVPCATFQWVEPTRRCCGATCRAIGNGAAQCADGVAQCANGCVACSAECGRQCVQGCEAGCNAVGHAAAECGRGCQSGCEQCGRCVGNTAAQCADGCQRGCNATVQCMARFPWGMRCLRFEEIETCFRCLGETGAACLLGISNGARAVGRCCRDEVCCYQQWPTLQQCQAGCNNCAVGCANCAAGCANGCVTGCANCAVGCANCAVGCANGCVAGVQECGRCTGECIEGCATGCAQCGRNCYACCEAGCGECARCCGQLQEQGRVCVNDATERGAACLAATAAGGVACLAATGDRAHRLACISIPSRFTAAGARAEAFRDMRLPRIGDTANRGVQRVNARMDIVGHRVNLRMEQPSRRQIRHAQRAADAEPENDALQERLEELEDGREAVLTERQIAKDAKHIWDSHWNRRRGQALGREHGIPTRKELVAVYKKNRDIRYARRYYQFLDERMAERGYADAYPDYYMQKVAARQQAGRLLADDAVMDDEEYQSLHNLLHTNGEQFKKYKAITAQLRAAHNPEARPDAGGTPERAAAADGIETLVRAGSGGLDDDAPAPHHGALDEVVLAEDDAEDQC